MPVHFFHDYTNDRLGWLTPGALKKVDVSLEEARVIAQAETAAALREIASAIRQLSEKNE